MKRQRYSLALVLVLAALIPAWSSRAETPAQLAIEKDIVYGKGGKEDLKLDLCRPAGDGPFPCVVVIHGGAWRAGSKADHDPTIKWLAQNGYVAASVEYRFCPSYKFPCQVEDCKCAVRFLHSKAAEYKIDPKKFAVMGDSAGGHLSLMLGFTHAKDGFDGKGGCADQSSDVQAVVNYYGPTDFGFEKFDPNSVYLVTDFLGTTDPKNPLVKQSSPITYVCKECPPVLTFHGAADPLVPVGQAKELHEALKKCGANERLEIIDGGGHGWGGKDRERSNKITMEFLDEVLKGKKP